MGIESEKEAVRASSGPALLCEKFSEGTEAMISKSGQWLRLTLASRTII
jgi:hypothetical protein